MRDLLRARRLALAVVRARAEVLLHRLDHRLDAAVALGLALRQQVEVRDLGRGEQLAAPFGQAATQAPQPMHAAASIAASATSFGTG